MSTNDDLNRAMKELLFKAIRAYEAGEADLHRRYEGVTLSNGEQASIEITLAKPSQ